VTGTHIQVTWRRNLKRVDFKNEKLKKKTVFTCMKHADEEVESPHRVFILRTLCK